MKEKIKVLLPEQKLTRRSRSWVNRSARIMKARVFI